MKTRHFALLGAFVPFAALISGCGGGGGGPSTGATPIPAPTFIGPSTSSPSFPTVTNPQTLLRLSSGQIAALNLTRNGSSAQGTLRVFNGMATDSSLNAGLYQVTGAFSGTSAFSVQGPETDANRFTLSGNLPQDGGSGNFNFKLGRSSGSGVLLPSNGGGIRPSGPPNAVGDLRFTNYIVPPNVNIGGPPLSVTPTGSAALTNSDVAGNQLVFGLIAYQIRNSALNDPRLDLIAERSDSVDPQQRLQIIVNILPNPSSQANPNLISAGQTFDLKPGVQTLGADARVTIIYPNLAYQARSGTMTIKSVGPESIVVDFKNVNVFIGPGLPSSFDVNGTLAVSGVATSISVPNSQ